MESSAVFRWTSRLTYFALVLFLGCEERPKLAMTKNPLPDSALQVENSIRLDSEAYDWPFSIEPPSGFEFFQRVPEIRSNPYAAEKIYTPFPEELAPDVELALEQLINSEMLHELPFSLPVSDGIEPRGFELSPDGTNLVTFGDKVQIWNISTRRQLSFACPEGAIRAFFDGSSDGVRSRSITVASGSAVQKFALPGGELVAQWVAPEPIEGISASRDRSKFAIVTKSLRLYALSNDLDNFVECASPPVSNVETSIHPAGKWVTACSSNGPVRWNLSENAKHYFALDAKGFDHRKSFSKSTSEMDFWIGPDLVHVFDSEAQILPLPEPSKQGRDGFLALGYIDSAEVCQEGGREWLLCLVKQPTPKGPLGWSLFDFDVSSPIPFSARVPLPFEPRDFSASLDGSTVAVSDSERVYVYERTPRIDPFGDATVQTIAGLANNRRFDQCSLAANWLREQNAFRFRQTGESLFAQIAETLGRQWHIAIADDMDSRAREFRAWSTGKSTLAKVASCVMAIRQLETMMQEAGKLQAMIDKGTVPEDAVVEVFEEIDQTETQIRQRIDALFEDLDELLAAERPPMIAFQLKIVSAAYLNIRFTELQSNIGRLLELYPFEASPHRQAFSLLSRDSESEARAYLAAYSKCFPAELQEQAYASCLLGSGGALDLFDSTDDSVGFNEVLALKGLESLAIRHRIRPNEIRSVVRLVGGFRNISPMLLDYMVKTFPLLPSNLYDASTQLNGGFADSFEAKRRAFESAR